MKPRFIAGGEPDDDQPDPGPKRLRYPCVAEQCPMPGTIFPSGGKGVCAWHYGTQGHDFVRVTQALLDWQCVSLEVEEARKWLSDPDRCADPKGLDEAMHRAWDRMHPALIGSGWLPHLQPDVMDHYWLWAKRIERFLGGRVADALSTRRAA